MCDTISFGSQNNNETKPNWINNTLQLCPSEFSYYTCLSFTTRNAFLSILLSIFVYYFIYYFVSAQYCEIQGEKKRSKDSGNKFIVFYIKKVVIYIFKQFSFKYINGTK